MDRVANGELSIEDETGVVYGPVAIRGKADGQIAKQHGNPTLNPTLPFGNHPGGTYHIVAIEKDKQPEHSYGPYFFLLDPVDGEALVAKQNGREGLAIHAGDMTETHGLRATEGCLRIYTPDARVLNDLVAPELALGHTVVYQCQISS